jgi:predicted DNA binding protein
MAAENAGSGDGVSIQLRISLPEECPLAGVEGEVVSANQQIVDGDCHSHFVVRPTVGGSDRIEMCHQSRPTTDPCICHVFCDHDTIPIFDRVESDAVVVSAYVADSGTAGELYDRLAEVVRGVEVLRLNATEYPDQFGSVSWVDLSALTDKQVEAIDLAVREGYYEAPKGTTISQLADEVGISRQAFSHRLSAAEAGIFDQIIGIV